MSYGPGRWGARWPDSTIRSSGLTRVWSGSITRSWHRADS